MRASLRAAAALAALILPACGGGGSGGSFIPGALFTSDRGTPGIAELFVADASGGGIRKLSGNLVTSSTNQIVLFKRSPDGTRVAFGIGDTVSVAVYVVSTSGGTPVLISPVGFETRRIEWASNSSRVAIGGKTPASTAKILTCLSDGTGSVEVTWPMPLGAAGVGSLGMDFWWHPAGGGLAYRADQSTAGVIELYFVQSDGTLMTKLSGPQVAGGDVSWAAWAPDGSRIAYLADQNTDGINELFTTSLTPLVNAKMSGTLVAGGVVNASFRWAPNSSRIAYVADQVTLAKKELFTSLADGTGNVQVSGGLVAAGDVSDGFAWSPDSLALAYLADQTTDGQVELFVSTPSGSINNKINGTLTVGGNVVGFTWAPDSSLIAYRADQDDIAQFEVFRSLPNGSSNVKIGAHDTINAVFPVFLWSPLSTRVTFVTDDPARLFTVLPDGTGKADLSSGLNLFDQFVPQGSWHEWLPDGSGILFIAESDSTGTQELYRASPDGTTDVVRLSGPRVSGSKIFEFVP